MNEFSLGQPGMFSQSPLNFFNVPSLNLTPPIANKSFGVPQINPQLFQPLSKKVGNKFSTGVKLAGISAATNLLAGLTSGMFGDSEIGLGMGALFSSGVGSAGDTMINNVIKGDMLTKGLGVNAGASLAGAGAGLAANFLGNSIASSGGAAARGIGAGLATGLGTVGGLALSNLVTNGSAKIAFGGSGLFGTTTAGAINPYALGASVIGSTLGGITGPSKEYGGEYGNITRTMDTVYDTATAAAGFIPGVGQGIAGVMALNKGLSNIFGSTDGMTKTDAILGSAFMPAPIKWLNAGFGKSTGKFEGQNSYTVGKTDNFMADAFGDMGDRFAKARKESGKKYGLFSSSARKRAQKNIDYSNFAFGQVLDMANQAQLQNIKSLNMSSINNQRYAQLINGGFKPLAVGRMGMKIFNNATNHSMGMRYLSAAALIDNKQMILSKCRDLD